MNIYVGNLDHGVTEEELRESFEAFGRVESAKIIKDMFSGLSRGFGFVEMESKEAGETAIADLNGKELNGRPLKVNEARPRRDNRSGGGGGGGGRYGGNRR